MAEALSNQGNMRKKYPDILNFPEKSGDVVYEMQEL